MSHAQRIGELVIDRFVQFDSHHARRSSVTYNLAVSRHYFALDRSMAVTASNKLSPVAISCDHRHYQWYDAHLAPRLALACFKWNTSGRDTVILIFKAIKNGYKRNVLNEHSVNSRSCLRLGMSGRQPSGSMVLKINLYGIGEQ